MVQNTVHSHPGDRVQVQKTQQKLWAKRAIVNTKLAYARMPSDTSELAEAALRRCSVSACQYRPGIHPPQQWLCVNDQWWWRIWMPSWKWHNWIGNSVPCPPRSIICIRSPLCRNKLWVYDVQGASVKANKEDKLNIVNTWQKFIWAPTNTGYNHKHHNIFFPGDSSSITLRNGSEAIRRVVFEPTYCTHQPPRSEVWVISYHNLQSRDILQRHLVRITSIWSWKHLHRY